MRVHVITIQKQSLKTVLVLIQKPISTAMAIVSMTVMQMAYVMNWKYLAALIQTQVTITTLQQMMTVHVSF